MKYKTRQYKYGEIEDPKQYEEIRTVIVIGRSFMSQLIGFHIWILAQPVEHIFPKKTVCNISTGLLIKGYSVQTHRSRLSILRFI